MNTSIRTAKKKGKANLVTKLRVGDKSVWLNLRLEVDVEEWLGKATEKTKDNYLKKLGHYSKLRSMEDRFAELRMKNQLTVEAAKEAIMVVVNAEYVEKAEKQLKAIQEQKERKSKDVLNYIENYISNAEKGEIMTNKGVPYTANSIKIMKQFLRIFTQFYRRTPFTWTDINKKLVDRFHSYLIYEDYSLSVQERYLSFFKTMILAAELEGLHSNGIAKYHIKGINVKDHDKAKAIYLTKEELDALYKMPLEGSNEQIRDIFLIGCYTAQRLSDYSAINEACLGKTAKGTSVIRLVQKKSNEKVVIPILDEKLKSLLEKYNYNVPNVCDVVFNRDIKEICRELSKDVPSLAKKERTRLTKAEKEAEEKGNMKFEHDGPKFVIKPRWQMVSSHTARRTAITNMVISGKYTQDQMMSVSGHKSAKTFRKYIKLSNDEFADSVAEASGVDGLF